MSKKAALHNLGGKVNAYELEAMQQILEKNGFINREQVEWDARLKKLTPTDKAKGVRRHILDNIRYIEKLLAGGIPAEKLAVCREVLSQMSENLSVDEKRREEIIDHE